MILRRITRPWDVQPAPKLRWLPPAAPAPPTPAAFQPHLIDHGAAEEEFFDRHTLGWLFLKSAPLVVDVLGPQMLKHPEAEEDEGRRRDLGIAWLFRASPPSPGLLKPIQLLKHIEEEEPPGERRVLGIGWLFAVPPPPPVPGANPPSGANYWWWFGPGAVGPPEMLTVLFPAVQAMAAADENDER